MSEITHRHIFFAHIPFIQVRRLQLYRYGIPHKNLTRTSSAPSLSLIVVCGRALGGPLACYASACATIGLRHAYTRSDDLRICERMLFLPLPPMEAGNATPARSFMPLYLWPAQGSARTPVGSTNSRGTQAPWRLAGCDVFAALRRTSAQSGSAASRLDHRICQQYFEPWRRPVDLVADT